MKKVDATVIRETKYIAAVTIIFSVLLQSVFLILSLWNYTVLLGNILGVLAAVGNFFLLGLTVQSAVNKDTDDAKNTMKLSKTLRFLLLFIIAVIGYLLPIFNTIAVIIPYLFPRIAIALRPILKKE